MFCDFKRYVGEYREQTLNLAEVSNTFSNAYRVLLSILREYHRS
jgi:hypothetical protein